MEQELASIFSFVLNAADNPQPYYENVPENFFVPAAYFAIPELSASGDTFTTYAAEYYWCVMFFHSTSQGALDLAQKAYTAIALNHDLIPLLDMNGVPTGRGVRIKDPAVKLTDECAARLVIRFISHRPYLDHEGMKMVTHKAFMRIKGGI